MYYICVCNCVYVSVCMYACMYALKFEQHSLASSKKYDASSKICDDILECFNKNKCAIFFILHT